MSRCLSGEYEHKLDAKGRLIMPLKLRAELGESFMVTKGIDKCLYVYSNEEWESFVEKLNKLPITNRTARTFKRRFLSGAVKCEPDGQGRILLSPMIFLPRSEVKFSDSTVHRLKGAHLLHKMTANAARLMRSMPSWEIL